MDRTINISLNSKVLAATALGAGVLFGAGTALMITRIHEHSNLTNLVCHLNSELKEVKDEITHLESELGRLQYVEHQSSESKPLRKRHRKAVSFSSTTTSASYKTATEDFDDTTYLTANDTLNLDGSKAYDTDYFSPDEDDDEFFDICQTDEEEDKEFGADPVDLARLLRRSDGLLDRSPDDQMKAYSILKQAEDSYANNAEVQWRLAKATRNIAIIEEMNGNLQNKKKLIDKAFEYAGVALSINGNSAEVHKWYAILAGARGEFLTTRERIESGHMFKEHIDRALALSPNDSTLHHLLGRFCYEVSLLSWIERKVAIALFSEVPSGTFAEALEHFNAAEELSLNDWKENKLLIAKCYQKLHQNDNATSWLYKAKEVNSMNAEDELLSQEIEELLQELQGSS